MSAAAEDGIDEHVPPSVLRGIKEELLLRDLINRMDIADGLKQLLISSGFTVKSLLIHQHQISLRSLVLMNM